MPDTLPTLTQTLAIQLFALAKKRHDILTMAFELPTDAEDVEKMDQGTQEKAASGE